MQSVISFTPAQQDVASYRRESSFWKSLILIDLDKGQTVADVRFYGAAQTVYCVAWLSHLTDYPGTVTDWSARGAGKAGGGGYHKPSAAMATALEHAGFKFAEYIHGCGDGAMTDALLAIAAHFGIARPYIAKAHG